MRWLLDECVDAALADQLRKLGHDVIYIAETAPQATDSDVLRRAVVEDRLLLTEDKDFGDLVIQKSTIRARAVVAADKRVPASSEIRATDRCDRTVRR
jgi:predicted nuclease of predicted toxin-antitoxin system